MLDGPPDALTRDTFFGGRLILEQPANGHRSGTDAVLLASAVPRDFEGVVYDMGAGVGAVGLGVAVMCPGAHVVLVDNDVAAVALARRNIEINGLNGRADVIECDLLASSARDSKLLRKADLVLTNPPFHRADHVRAPHDASRRAAHVMGLGASLSGWLRACLNVLGAKGTLIVVHQAAAIPEMLGTLTGRVGALTLLAVQPHEGEPAHRVLLRGRNGSRAAFRVAAPLILHEGNGFGTVATALHQGTAALVW